MAKSTKNDSRPAVGWPHAFRDILVAAVNRGQFPFFCIFLIFLLLVFKMPSEEAGRLIIDLEHDLRDMHILGWVLELFTLVAWVWLNRRQRRTYRDEINRISEEKSAAQTAELGSALVKSSRNKR
jgi:hypothetical protein